MATIHPEINNAFISTPIIIKKTEYNMKKAYKGSFMILFIVAMVLVSPESLAQTKHYIGEKWGGGIVFIVVADGLHGLIAETKDQGDCAWKETTNLINKKSKS